jgi:DNA primase
MHKSKRAIADKGTAIVLEGQLDLITAFEAGVQNVVAPQGTAFTEKQARMLKRFADEAVLCFDADSAGAKATERSLAALLDANLIVRVATMPAGHDPDSLIRKEGPEAFVEQIAAARDFFDFQIDHYATRPDFATPRGKLQFSRKMAESVGLITDAVLRESVARKVATRLEISLDDFWGLLGKAAKRETGGQTSQARALLSQSTAGSLSLLALRDQTARSWIQSQDWRELLPQLEETELLGKILSAGIRPGIPASVSAFIAELAPEEERAVAALLEEKLPENPLVVAQDCWRDLQRRDLTRRLHALTARQRAPSLAPAEIINLQKQILDLQKRLTDIARPFA